MKSYDHALLEKILEVVNSNIKPSLNMDGGDLSVVSLEGNKLYVKLLGACSCCPRAAETLKYGVEKTLQHFVSSDLVIVAV
ncbi:NifU family protein [Alphaproteobacteria bacterium]|nr:NifU family protein [Alphaproteobacteria bacterium]GHT90320.1 NifU family protein [Alphaproteobacteria bacterium]